MRQRHAVECGINRLEHALTGQRPIGTRARDGVPNQFSGFYALGMRFRRKRDPVAKPMIAGPGLPPTGLFEFIDVAAPGPLAQALEHSRAGRGASALVAAENTLLALMAGHRDGGPFTPDLAWALSQHSEILHRFGDPDLAVAAADLALLAFIERRDEINQTVVAKVSYARAFVRAALVSADVHSRFGRPEYAQDARDCIAGLSGEATEVTIEPALPFLADTSLARALERVPPASLRARTASGMLERIRDSITAPATDRSFLLTFQRCSDHDPVLVADALAAAASQTIAADQAAGVRLGLEAHVLYARQSEMRDPQMRYNLGEHGPLWARALLSCSQAADQYGLRELALDLAAWMGGVVENLMPFALISPETRDLTRECLAWHVRILKASGESDGARNAAQALRNVEALP